MTALVRDSKQGALQSCEQLEQQCSAFGSTFKDFMQLVQHHGSELHFTQSKTEQYWNRAAEHTRQLERYSAIAESATRRLWW